MTNQPKCFFVANTDWALFNFRRGLIKELQNNSAKVVCVCADTGFWNSLKTLNLYSLLQIQQYVKHINPVKDIKLLLEYYHLYRRLKPDIVHHFTIKPVIYGSLAAKMARVPVIINTITGLGYVFTDGHKHNTWLRLLCSVLYKLSASVSDYVWFQNKHDRDYFVRNKIVPKKRSSVVFGSGVDIDYFSPDKVNDEKVCALRKELKLTEFSVLVIMVARLLYDKGVHEFIEASKTIAEKMTHVKFLLVGPLAPGNPSMIPLNQINKWCQEGIVRYLGRRSDIRELIHLADIAVLPSYYKEGIPKSLLEASAMGKPIITTNNVGCQEVVDHGKNGLLIPIRNSAALQEAIKTLVLNKKLREAMGKASSLRAINEFDEKKIIKQTLVGYKKICNRKGIMIEFEDIDRSS
jgi:glycosyltransferase involved in cell wall biosynthesis